MLPSSALFTVDPLPLNLNVNSNVLKLNKIKAINIYNNCEEKVTFTIVTRQKGDSVNLKIFFHRDCSKWYKHRDSKHALPVHCMLLVTFDIGITSANGLKST